MPDMDGIELTRRLKADPPLRNVRLLAEFVRPRLQSAEAHKTGSPQPDEAGAIVRAVRLPYHQPQLGVDRPREPRERPRLYPT